MVRILSILLLPLCLSACSGDEDSASDACTGGSDPGSETCEGMDYSPCEVTCVCDAGELDVGACVNGSCQDIDTMCGTGCPNFDMGEWGGEFCNR